MEKMAVLGQHEFFNLFNRFEDMIYSAFVREARRNKEINLQ
jgi:hypothetical protein